MSILKKCSYLDFAIHSGGEQKMAALWEEANGGDAAGVCVAPLVDEAFWQEAAFRWLICGQADAGYVVRWVEE